MNTRKGKGVINMGIRVVAMTYDRQNTKGGFPVGQEVYIGTKIVRAYAMDEVSYKKEIKKETCENQETRLGYVVTYEDGYKSWSPKEVFERCYRPITISEKNLI